MTKNYTIQICDGFTCKESFADDVAKKAQQESENSQNIKISRCGCMGLCAIGPNARIINDNTGEIRIESDLTPETIKKEIDQLKKYHE